MALEDLTGNKYLNDLNPNWPLGSDYPSDGDDHIRGIKNVLQKTFPSITGPVTLTQDQVNTGSVPAGSRLLFYNSAAPVGWTRVPDLGTTYSVKVQASTDAGGTSAGTDNPVLNDKIQSHTHTSSGVTDVKSYGHQHAFNVNSSVDIPAHAHSVPGATVFRADGVYGTAGSGTVTSGNNSVSHVHNVSGATDYQDMTHSHTLTLATGGPQGAAVGSWAPRHLSCILCYRE